MNEKTFIVEVYNTDYDGWVDCGRRDTYTQAVEFFNEKVEVDPDRKFRILKIQVMRGTVK